jgi:hypothetical protein
MEIVLEWRAVDDRHVAIGGYPSSCRGSGVRLRRAQKFGGDVRRAAQTESAVL